MNLLKPLLNVCIAVVATSLSFAATAQSASYSLNATDVAAFGSGSFGSVSLTQSASDVLVSVSLRSDLNFVDTGSHSIFSFNLGGKSSKEDIGSITFANGLKNVFGVEDGSANSPFSTFTYQINCVSNCTRGGSGGGYVDPLNFTVHNALVSEFGQLSTGKGTAAYFAADVINLSGNTGVIGATVAAVPEPETYAMMLAGLCLMGWTAGRRKLSSARGA